MRGRHHDVARFQSDFYRDCYYKVLRWLFIEIVAMFILIGAIMYVLFTLAEPQYYATTIGGQLIPLTVKT